MARTSTRQNWLRLSFLAALFIPLAVGWWVGRQTRFADLEARKSRLEQVSPPDSVENLRSEGDDLIRFIDETYALLRAEGIHVQLELDKDQDGHYRLRAETVELTDELKAKLRALKQRADQAPPNGP